MGCLLNIKYIKVIYWEYFRDTQSIEFNLNLIEALIILYRGISYNNLLDKDSFLIEIFQMFY